MIYLHQTKYLVDDSSTAMKTAEPRGPVPQLQPRHSDDALHLQVHELGGHLQAPARGGQNGPRS